MKISDLRIGVKLAAGFLAVVLLTALLGAIALVQMSRIHANAEEIATNLLPSVTQTGELRVLLNFSVLSRGISALRYQLLHHPNRVQVPMQALLHLLELWDRGGGPARPEHTIERRSDLRNPVS